MEWIVLGRGGRTRPLARAAALLPASLELSADGTDLFGLSDGEVWRIETASGAVRNLTANFAPAVHSLELVSGALLLKAGEPGAADQAFLRSGHRAFPTPSLADYAFQPATQDIRKLTKPIPVAILRTYAPASGDAAYVKMRSHLASNDQTLWRGTMGQAPELLLTLNAFLRSLRKPQERVIEYTTLTGRRELAKLTLPYGYVPGRRYPVFVDSDTDFRSTRGRGSYSLHPEKSPIGDAAWCASMGYIHLWASMPTTVGMDSEVGRSNLLQLTDGIVPALDEAIDAGFADPERLFLFGWSSMGYGVYGLVTQTSRFSAAAAIAGWADQAEHVLTTDFTTERSDAPHDGVRLDGWRSYLETALPSWRDTESYRRNSPMNYVDRVRTPLLIVHGEMDGSPLSEVDKFFKALTLQRKPAMLVRYWGSGHYLRAPVIGRDLYQRVFAWFDRWGDISRDAKGELQFQGERVRSRNGAAPLQPQEYAGFDLFGPGGQNTATGTLLDTPRPLQD